ncbi:MAG: squalene/phytoene synthase family protein, partial [Pseudomonadota bacterium]
MPSSSPPTTPTSTPTSAAVAAPPTHYENFPVASWLCPPRLRPPIAAIYHFARTADDLADEGDATPEARLADMRAYQEDLSAVLEGGQPSPRWAAVFVPLRNAIATFCLPGDQLAALLEAFTEDLVRDAACQSGDAEGAAWRDRDALLGYCSRSANPVGRLLLHLYGVTDA